MSRSGTCSADSQSVSSTSARCAARTRRWTGCGARTRRHGKTTCPSWTHLRQERPATDLPRRRLTGPNTTTPPETRGMPYQSGDVLLADLDPVAGHEQGGRRPVLVLSGASYNELRNEQLIVAAITSRQRGLPFHIPVGVECGLRTPSWVQSESVRAISVERVIRQLGRARAGTVTEVRNRVINFLRDW